MAIVVKLGKEEKNHLKRVFSLYGAKTKCSEETGVNRKTLNDLLERGQATEPVVQKIREYAASL